MVQRKKGVKDTGRQRAVIFDFDGTIADSFDYVFNFLKSEAKNTDTLTSKQQKELRKMSMKRLALHLGVPFWRLPMVYFKGRRVMRAHMEHVQPFAGMEAVIQQLHEQGCALFIASSNSPRNIRRLLKQRGIAVYFKAVRGGAGFTGKASLIRQLLLRYRLPKATTWYVGDETSDVVAASAAGLKCLAVGWGFADPEKLKQLEPAAFAERVSDIPKILEAAWKK
jgi:phosphoglycolate phosphatase